MKRILKLTRISMIFSIVIIMASCVKKVDNNEEREIQLIEDFMLQQGYDITALPSGLYYKDIVVGVGEPAEQFDTVEVYYSGFFLSGIQFDSNVGGDLFRFVVKDDVAWVIDGFDEALTYMREGGESIAIIPSWIGYGTRGSGPIPANTPIIFELELVNILRGPGTK